MSLSIRVGFRFLSGFTLGRLRSPKITLMLNPVKRTFSFSVVFVVFMVGLFSLVACTPPPPTQQFRLRVGTYKTQDYLPYYVMTTQGFSRENGIEFEEIPVQGGAAVIEGIVKGAIDVGYVGTVPVCSAAERGVIPDSVLPVAANNFADRDHPIQGVLAARSFKGWKDLEGQYIAVVAVNSITAAAIQGRLLQENVHDYKLVEIPFANCGLAVAGGNVAAAVMVEPFLTQSLLRGDGELLGWVVGGPPFERMEYTMIVFKADIQRNNAGAVKAFLRSHLKAVRWMNRNPEGARSTLTQSLDLNREIGWQVNMGLWPLDARSNPDLLQEMQSVLVSIGLLKETIPVSHLYDETLLEQVLAENP